MTSVRCVELIEAVQRITRICCDIKPKEKVLIITDTPFDQDIVWTFASDVQAIGADLAVVIIPPRERIGYAPPAHVEASILASDVILDMCEMWFGSSMARVEAVKRGARYNTMPGLSKAMLRKNGPCYADFPGLEPGLLRLKEMFTQASRIRVQNRAGTDIEAGISGRPGRMLHGMCNKPHSYQAAPDMEGGIGPLEDHVEGIIVVDAMVELLHMGMIKPGEYVRMSVEKGKIVKFEGDGEGAWQAKRLKTYLDGYNHPGMFQIAEISLGLNPHGLICRDYLECEGAVTGGHFGFGDNRGYDGINAAPGHHDVIIRDISIQLDDTWIIRDGVPQIPEIPQPGLGSHRFEEGI